MEIILATGLDVSSKFNILSLGLFIKISSLVILAYAHNVSTMYGLQIAPHSLFIIPRTPPLFTLMKNYEMAHDQHTIQNVFSYWQHER